MQSTLRSSKSEGTMGSSVGAEHARNQSSPTPTDSKASD